MADLDVAMILRLVDRVSGPLKQVQSNMRQTGVLVDNAGRSMIERSNRLSAGLTAQRNAALGQGAAVAAAGIAMGRLLRPATQFESAMAGVGAVSRASDEDLAVLTATARELGATTAWSASEAADGMRFLAMAGFDVNQVIGTMPGMLDLASAGAIQLASAADIASNILTGFGLRAEDMNRVGDVLTNTFTGSNTDLLMLGETMKYVAPTAAALGISLEETAAMAGKLGDAGIQGSNAGTALRSIMSRLAAPTGAAADALADLGLQLQDAEGNLRPVPVLLAEMDAAMRGLGSAAQADIRKTVFELEAASAAAVLMEQAGSGALGEFTERLREQGSAARVAGAQMDTAAGDLKRLQSQSEALAIALGTTLIPMLRDALAAVGPIIEKLTAWAEANPELVEGLASVVAMLLGLKVAGVAARLGLIALGGPLVGVLRFAGVALRVLSAIGLLNPFTLVIAGAAAAIYAIHENWDGITAWWQAKVDALYAAFDVGLVQGIATLVSQFNPVTLIAEALGAWTIWLMGKVGDLLQMIDDRMRGFSLYDAGVAMIQSLWDGAKSLVGRMVADIKARLAGLLPDRVAGMLGLADPTLDGPVGAAPTAPVILDSRASLLGTGGGSRATTNVDVGGITVNAAQGQSPLEVARAVAGELDRAKGTARQPLSDGGLYAN
jgi:TP901 family phage tail tape measure protein